MSRNPLIEVRRPEYSEDALINELKRTFPKWNDAQLPEAVDLAVADNNKPAIEHGDDQIAHRMSDLRYEFYADFRPGRSAGYRASTRSPAGS